MASNVTYIADAPLNAGTEVNIRGWVDSVRDKKTMQFLIIHDETGRIQAANEKSGKPLDEIISGISKGSTIKLSGKVIQNPQVRQGGYEVVLNDVQVTSKAESPLPISDATTDLEIRMNYRWLDLRQPKNKLIFQIQTTAEHAMRQYWINNGFIEMHSPKLMGAASEGGAELFSLPYFGKTAALAQSPQFYKQMAMAAGWGKVFEIGPVFRANPSFTSRHDTEFTSVDVELSFVDSHYDVMEFEENWLNHIFTEVATKHGKQIQETFGVPLVVPTTPFPKLTMKEAYAILDKRGHKLSTDNGDLDPAGERLVAEHVQKEMGHEFVFVVDYPISVRPFYHMRHAEAPGLTKSFDLLWKGLEITTGAQREHRYERLTEQAVEKGVKPETISDYLNFFRYGCPPHGGYGFGLSRMLMMMTGLKNVREVTYLYRGPNRLTP